VEDIVIDRNTESREMSFEQLGAVSLRWDQLRSGIIFPVAHSEAADLRPRADQAYRTYIGAHGSEEHRLPRPPGRELLARHEGFVANPDFGHFGNTDGFNRDAGARPDL
jgi:hypothetical protein